MSATTFADDYLTDCDDVDRLCGKNEHLVNDDLLGRIVEAAINGRHTFGHEVRTGHAPVEADVRVLPACRGLDARRVTDPAARSDVNVYTVCDRCDGHYGTRNGGRVLWMPAGRSVIEFGLCLVCVDYLNENFGPVDWRS